MAGVAPNATSYTGAIAACSKAGDGDKALEWLKVMSKEGIAPEVSILHHLALHIFAVGRFLFVGYASWRGSRVLKALLSFRSRQESGFGLWFQRLEDARAIFGVEEKTLIPEGARVIRCGLCCRCCCHLKMCVVETCRCCITWCLPWYVLSEVFCGWRRSTGESQFAAFDRHTVAQFRKTKRFQWRATNGDI